MENRLKACLVLGCNGCYTANGFLNCSSVENVIFDFDSFTDEKYLEILDFLENACDLFSVQMNDYNKCVNSLSLLYRNYQAYNQSMLYDIQAFFKIHKACGIWIIIVLKEDLNG